MFTRTIQDALIARIRGTGVVRAVYDHPAAEYARAWPAAVVVLQSARYTPVTARQYQGELTFGISVVTPLDGRNAAGAWQGIIDAVDAIMDAIAADPTLGGAAHSAHPIGVEYGVVPPESEASLPLVRASMTVQVTADRG